MSFSLSLLLRLHHLLLAVFILFALCLFSLPFNCSSPSWDIFVFLPSTKLWKNQDPVYLCFSCPVFPIDGSNSQSPWLYLNLIIINEAFSLSDLLSDMELVQWFNVLFEIFSIFLNLYFSCDDLYVNCKKKWGTGSGCLAIGRLQWWVCGCGGRKDVLIGDD